MRNPNIYSVELDDAKAVNVFKDGIELDDCIEVDLEIGVATRISSKQFTYKDQGNFSITIYGVDPMKEPLVKDLYLLAQDMLDNEELKTQRYANKILEILEKQSSDIYEEIEPNLIKGEMIEHDCF